MVERYGADTVSPVYDVRFSGGYDPGMAGVRRRRRKTAY